MQLHAQAGFKEEKICIGKTRNQFWRKYLLKRLQREIIVYYPYGSFSCCSACFSLPSSCALIQLLYREHNTMNLNCILSEWVPNFGQNSHLTGLQNPFSPSLLNRFCHTSICRKTQYLVSVGESKGMFGRTVCLIHL